MDRFDYFFGTDYFFLRAKPADPSLLDFLGPWPWYILSTEGVALILFLLIYLPVRRSRERKPIEANRAHGAWLRCQPLGWFRQGERVRLRRLRPRCSTRGHTSASPGH